MNYDEEELEDKHVFKMSDDGDDDLDDDLLEPMDDDFGLDEEDPDHDS